MASEESERPLSKKMGAQDDHWVNQCRMAWAAAVDAVGSESLLALREAAMPFQRASRSEHEAAGLQVREAAVLWLLFPDAVGAWRGVLMERTPYEGVHGGQISMPGGEREPHDEDFQATALREFAEEMGAEIAAGSVIGRLHPLYIPPSRFAVEPFVAVAPAEPAWAPDATEVAAVLRPSLRALCVPGALSPRRVQVTRQTVHEMPSYDVEGRVVWGATALMLTEFTAVWGEVLRQGRWPDLSN
jgi:8-oxo-dGTP pyrophosphatase MutT (NUDIX family)